MSLIIQHQRNGLRNDIEQLYRPLYFFSRGIFVRLCFWAFRFSLVRRRPTILTRRTTLGGKATRGKKHRGDSPPSGKDALQGTCGSESKASDGRRGENRGRRKTLFRVDNVGNWSKKGFCWVPPNNFVQKNRRQGEMRTQRRLTTLTPASWSCWPGQTAACWLRDLFTGRNFFA